MPHEMAVIPFHASALRVTKDGDQVWVAIRPICEHLGIDSPSQIEKLRQDDDFQPMAYPISSPDGKVRMQVCLPETQLLGWLYTISSNRVAVAVRPLLKAYRQETMQAINAYWTKGRAIKLPTSFADALQLAANLEKEREQLEKANRLQEARILADAPKVVAWGEAISLEGCQTLRDALKGLSLAPNLTIAQMRRDHYLMENGLPYQRYIEQGLFEVKEVADPSGIMRSQTKITPKGVGVIGERYCGNDALSDNPKRRRLAS